MWKNQNGRLVQTTDATRVRYKTRISAARIEQLQTMAHTYNTHIGYLLESGYEALLQHGAIQFDKQARPKDRIEFRTTCDAALLEALKVFAKQSPYNLNDVIEASIRYIDTTNIKHADWRYRIEN